MADILTSDSTNLTKLQRRREGVIILRIVEVKTIKRAETMHLDGHGSLCNNFKALHCIIYSIFEA